MQATPEKSFDKYRTRGTVHWREMMSRDPRVFNAIQQSRYEWIVKLAGTLRGKKVIDLGCGDGSLTYLISKAGGVVTGVDNDELGIKYANENLGSVKDKRLEYSFTNASVTELPFEDNSFDVAVSCEVIEHLKEPEKMLREAWRVLRSGGVFVLTTPYKLTEVPSDPNHVKEYYPGEIQRMLEAYFQSVAVKPVHHIAWRGVYTYAFRTFRNRPLGKWCINFVVLLSGRNPFMIDYDPPAKFDAFATICARGIVIKK